jgi:transposase
MSKKKPTYSKEFKTEAIRLSVESGKAVSEVARELGIDSGLLYSWRQQARRQHQLPVSDQETPEQEVKRLRRELDLVKQERDILKKAMAYFAQPPKK